MELKRFMALGIKPREGIEFTKCMINASLGNEETIKAVISAFNNHGFDINEIPASFHKMFTINDKELKELEDVLDRIDTMDTQIEEGLSLKSIFQSDLSFGCFTPGFIDRLSDCMTNGISFLYEDNTFIKELFSAEAYAAYKSNALTAKPDVDEEEPVISPFENTSFTEPVNDSNEPAQLTDPEDIQVRTSIMYELTRVMEANPDNPTLSFLITNIIANLNDVIATDNKNYRELGTRHLVVNALQGVNITPELQFEIEEKVLKSFPDFHESREGVQR